MAWSAVRVGGVAGEHAAAVVEDEGCGAEAVGDVLGRTAYRVVQEGLTNAHKHAPAAAVEVLVAKS